MISIMSSDLFPQPKKTTKSTPRSPKPFVKNDMKEKKLEQEIIWMLNLIPHIIAWKSGEDSTYNSKHILPGIPDIQGFHLKDKYTFFIEVKTKGGHWRHTQVAFMGICHQAGIKYILAYSTKDVLDELNHQVDF